MPTVSSEERVKYRNVTVQWIAQVIGRDAVGDRLVRLVMSIPENYRPTALDTVAVDIGCGQLRRYTVSTVGESCFDIVAFRTERGPATAFLDAATVGDDVKGLGPARPVKTPQREFTKVVVVGDETVVGTARGVAGLCTIPVVACVMSGHDLSGIAPTFPDLDMTAVTNENELLAWLDCQVRSCDPSEVGVWVVGEPSINHAVRMRAKELGVNKDDVATRTFWRPDRVGIE